MISLIQDGADDEWSDHSSVRESAVIVNGWTILSRRRKTPTIFRQKWGSNFLIALMQSLLFKQCRLDERGRMKCTIGADYFEIIGIGYFVSKRDVRYIKLVLGLFKWNPDWEVCLKSPPEWKSPIWELQIRPGFTAAPASWRKKWEIQMLLSFSSFEAFRPFIEATDFSSW